MTYQMVATAVTLNDLEGHSPLADVFKCNPSNICPAFYTISTDGVLAWFLCISRAFCFHYDNHLKLFPDIMRRVKTSKKSWPENEKLASRVYSVIGFLGVFPSPSGQGVCPRTPLDYSLKTRTVGLCCRSCIV